MQAHRPMSAPFMRTRATLSELAAWGYSGRLGTSLARFVLQSFDQEKQGCRSNETRRASSRASTV
jgi:hypothetical protein